MFNYSIQDFCYFSSMPVLIVCVLEFINLFELLIRLGLDVTDHAMSIHVL